MTTAPATPRTGFQIERVFSTEGVHPYEELDWEKRDIVQKNWRTGEVIFEQSGVEFPTCWSENASTIVATKYFRANGAHGREHSLKQLIDRVVSTYANAAVEHGYMDNDAANVFADELTWLLVNQYFAFNSPVWFNVGTEEPQRVSACFILSVEDTMESILDWYKEEGMIFKGGSGAGTNLSKIRSTKELLSSGGTASGPVSFMRGADASAGTIKSGGATRRAAKLVCLDVDHPDIVEFIDTKAKEEKKIQALRDAGFDMDLSGADISSVQYQNANNSVRVSDEFMQAVVDGTTFDLRARTTGEVVDSVDARELFGRISQAAWECADPGLIYDTTVNEWHTNPNTGRINAANPCVEYHSLDDSACNLASLNLVKFVGSDNVFDIDRFTAAVEAVITAMEISVAFGDFPTEKITTNTRAFRQLGIGYANLGALLMRKGLAYDSPQGRALAASITSLMSSVAYRRSAEIASIVGPYDGYEVNKDAHKKVMMKHEAQAWRLTAATKGSTTNSEAFVADGIAGANEEAALIAQTAEQEWGLNLAKGDAHGWRNAQISVLAPTGTIGFMMDCDTTGIEPDFSLVKFKKLVGGGSMNIVNAQVAPALATLGYDSDEIAKIETFIMDNGHVVGAPGLSQNDYAVFDTAAGAERQIEPMGHVRMMAACQPFLSGAISKTVNLPESATVEDIEQVYMESWKLGLKATAVYRDNCKVGQPLSSTKKEDAAASEVAEPEVRIVEVPRREKLPRTREALVTSFDVGGAEGYLSVGQFPDGRPGEIFLKMSKQGSTLAGVMDAFSIAVSIGLQYGVPLETYVTKFTNQRFEPSGFTDDPDIRMSQSLVDYVFRRLALDYMPVEERAMLRIFSVDERKAIEAGEDVAAAEVAVASAPEPVPVEARTSAELIETMTGVGVDAPLCLTCGVKMRPSGSCYVCESCGSTSGCS